MNHHRDDERTQLEEPLRVAVIADGGGSGGGVAQTLAQLRQRGIVGHEIEVIGTGAEALTDRRYDLVHVGAAGPAGIAAQRRARVIGLPIVGSYDTDIHGYARTSTEDPRTAAPVEALLRAFYGKCDVVLSPGRASDRALGRLGVAPEGIHRWSPGVDVERFHPARYAPDVLPVDRFNVLYSGRLGRENGLALLSEAFQIARDRDPRLHLVLAGAGPEEDHLAARLGSAATFLGWLDGDALARVYASADLFVFPSVTDTFGRVILEAQASGLPVLAVDAGTAAELIETGRSGCLAPPEPEALAGALRGLARRAALRDRLITGGLLAIREHTWERSLAQLAEGWAVAVQRRLRAPARPSASEVARAA